MFCKIEPNDGTKKRERNGVSGGETVFYILRRKNVEFREIFLLLVQVIFSDEQSVRYATG